MIEKRCTDVLILLIDNRILGTNTQSHRRSYDPYIRTRTKHDYMSYGKDSSYGQGRGRSYGGGGSRGFNYSNCSPTPKPVEVGKEYEVDVTDISRKGDGIARVQGFVVFVENGKVGHRLDWKILKLYL